MSTPSTLIHDDRKLGALTGIRFLAAGAVLISHYAQLAILPVPMEVVHFLDGGRPAVVLFFVLSGFILAYNYYDLTGSANRRSFWIARFARLYPNVVFALFIAIPTVIIALRDRGGDYLMEWFSLDGQYALSLGVSFIAQVTMTTAWLPVASFNQPWNGPAWSIGCEVFFYALFPLLLARMRRLSWFGILVWTIAGFVAQGTLIALVRALVAPDRAGFLVSQFPVTHLFGFFLGIVTARVFIEHGQRLGGLRWFRLGALATGWGMVCVLGAWQPVQPVYYMMTPFFAMIILALALPTRSGSGRSWLAFPLLLLLGEASYALYLIHLPLGHLLDWVGVDGLAGAAATVAVIALSVAVLRFWETPARRMIRNRLGHASARER